MHNKRLLILTGERSGLNAILPAIERLKEDELSRIRLVAPDYSGTKEIIRSNIKIPSINNLEFTKNILMDYSSVFIKIVKYIQDEQITDILFVDNPDFNLLIARFLRHRVRMYYYIIPQIWAWREYRVKYLKRYFKKLFVIFPFEVELLKKYGIESRFVGHPLYEKTLEDVNPIKVRKGLKIGTRNRVISLFPGSRENVLKRHFKLFEDLALLLSEKLPGSKIVISDVSNYHTAKRGKIIYTDIPSIHLLRISDFAIISSGSTTMEATFLNVPFIGIYRPDILTYATGRFLLRIDTTIMPNILLGERFIPEIVSPYLTHNDVLDKIINLLNNPEQLSILRKKLQSVTDMFRGFTTSEIMSQEIEEILR